MEKFVIVRSPIVKCCGNGHNGGTIVTDAQTGKRYVVSTEDISSEILAIGKAIADGKVKWDK